MGKFCEITMIKLMHIGIEAGTGKWLSRALCRMTNCIEINAREKLNIEKIRNLFYSFDPDIVFMQTQSDNPELLSLVAEMSKKSVVINWSGDVRDPIPEWYYKFDKYCVTCFSNMRDVRQMNGEYLQIGIDPEIYYFQKKEKIYDIVFMANRSMSFPLSPYRIQVVEFLKRKYGDRFKIFGNWPGADGNLMKSQHEEAEIYRHSKIGISVSHFDIERYFSDRLLRIMACGCLALSHHYTDIELDFKPGEQLETFKDFDELKRKIDYYLANDRERELIAARGILKVQRSFTTKNMVQDIIKIYKKYKNYDS